MIGVLVTGAALAETIFAWPGLGRLLLEATLNRDYAPRSLTRCCSRRRRGTSSGPTTSGAISSAA